MISFFVIFILEIVPKSEHQIIKIINILIYFFSLRCEQSNIFILPNTVDIESKTARILKIMKTRRK